MAGVGRIFKRKMKLADGRVVEDPIWHVAFYHRGKEYRLSSQTDNEVQARKFLKKKLGELGRGRFVPNEERVAFEDLCKLIRADYAVNDYRSAATLNFTISHLESFFKFDRAVDITPDRVLSYQQKRLSEGAARRTVNLEVATLGRMLTLAVDLAKISWRPKFKLLEGENVREGFLQHGDFLALHSGLPEYLKDFVAFLYYGGWRKGAARNLQWKDIDLETKTARLAIKSSKNKEPWVLPLAGQLWEILERRIEQRRPDCSYVFHYRNGKKIGDFRKVWDQACKAAGLIGVIPHDLRRCAARNLSLSGVREQLAMKITGHKTNSMYRRYRIVDEDELRQAQEQQQAFLQSQAKVRKVVPLRTGTES
jgi:integrase